MSPRFGMVSYDAAFARLIHDVRHDRRATGPRQGRKPPSIPLFRKDRRNFSKFEMMREYLKLAVRDKIWQHVDVCPPRVLCLRCFLTTGKVLSEEHYHLSFLLLKQLCSIWPEGSIWTTMPVQGLTGDAKLGTQVTHRCLRCAHRYHGQTQRGWSHRVRASTRSPACPCRGQACSGPFRDQLAFTLGEGGEDPENQLPCRSDGINCRSMACQHREPDAPSGQIMDGIDQMA